MIFFKLFSLAQIDLHVYIMCTMYAIITPLVLQQRDKVKSHVLYATRHWKICFCMKQKGVF